VSIRPIASAPVARPADYLRRGPEELSSLDLLSLAVGPLAATALLAHFGSVPSMLGASAAALAAAPGLSRNAAVRLHALCVLARRPAGPPPSLGRVVRPQDALPWLRPRLTGLTQEEVHALFLDRQMRVIFQARLTRGTADQAMIDPRTVMGEALRVGASAVVLAHNHPSGQAEPSDEDRRATRRIRDAGVVVGVTLADHLIVTDESWCSMALRGDL
jgi:DNA repair protein RadC